MKDYTIFTHWTLGQDSGVDVTDYRAQPLDNDTILMIATVGEVPPTSDEGAVRLWPQTAKDATISLADWFPSVTGANRVYLRSATKVSKVSVDYA